MHCGTCSCGKACYRSRKEARNAARFLFPGDRLSAYVCRINPAFFHIGHLPQAITRGEQARDELTPALRPPESRERKWTNG